MFVLSKLLTPCSVRSVKSSRAASTFLRSLSSASPGILDSGVPDIEIANVSIPEFIRPKLTEFGNLIATECVITGRKYTYRDILIKSENLAKSLRKRLGLNEGDVVAVLLPNCPEYPLINMAVLEAGLIMTTCNPLYTPEEICRQLKDSSAKVIITLVELWDVTKSATNLLKKQLPIIVIKTQQTEALPQGAIHFLEFTDNKIDFPNIRPRRPEDVASLPYSSGTTGLPKGVQLLHKNLVANISQNLAEEIDVFEKPDGNHQDVVPAILPMFHIFGYTITNMVTLCRGARVLTLPKFTPDQFVALLRDYRPHVMALVPPIVLFLSTHATVKSEYFQNLRTVVCGAAPLGSSDEQRFIEKAGKNVTIIQGYGMTETSPTVCLTPLRRKSVKVLSGSIGLPVPNTLLKVVTPDDPTGTPLGPNIPGELLIKGPQVMQGYHNRPEDTKNAFLDGWLKTGDMVYYNEDKHLFVTDRLKELIKVKGFQVPPAELEEVIRSSPDVTDVAVIGVPHPLHGESPRAYVVVKNKAKFKAEDLEKFVADKVAPYKRLTGGIEIVESIPKNASGKIMRRTLKLQYEKEHGQC